MIFSTKVCKSNKMYYLCSCVQTKIVKIMENQSFRQRIINMAEGESITISLDELGYTTIRTYASDLGFYYNRKYTARRNKEERTYTITRLS